MLSRPLRRPHRWRATRRSARRVTLGAPAPQVLSNSIKQKRKEKAGKWNVPVPKVRPVGEDEVFKVMKSGKRQKKAWKRQVSRPP